MNLLLEAGHGTEGFWDKYLELLGDPAHWAFEITVTVIVDLIIIGLLWPLVVRWVKRHDETHHPNDLPKKEKAQP